MFWEECTSCNYTFPWFGFSQQNTIFSAPQPKAQVHYCDHALSVILPSVVHPSVHPSLTFTFSTSPLKRLNGIQQSLTGSKISTSSTKFVFFGRSKQDGRPGLWLAETFSTFLLKQLNRIQWNLTRNQVSTSSTNYVFFRPIGITRWPSWPLIGWDIFDFSSETAERTSTKLDRKQDLNVFYQVSVFPVDQKNEMTAPASDWLRHFRLLLWNRWTEFNEAWQEARSQCPLPSLCFSGQ